jgi:hypothetical protein
MVILLLNAGAEFSEMEVNGAKKLKCWEIANYLKNLEELRTEASKSFKRAHTEKNDNDTDKSVTKEDTEEETSEEEEEAMEEDEDDDI